MVAKYRKQIRLKKYDYSDAGWYFVTICTQNSECLLGNIFNNKIVLNQKGLLINDNWKQLINKFPIELDEFVIMPNHVHGIIIIRQTNIVGVSFMKPETKMTISKSNHHMGLLNHKKGLINQTPTLGLIIRYFKSKCTYELHKDGFNNDLWQRNYYEHIIRNEFDLNRIRQYIRNNPMNWNEDRNNLFNQQPNGN
ncbi:transposase [Candidatus Roizmanbacteria bacterium]|nr:transposase [Candidatus Roizmanbacteria bacterium]